MDRRPHRGHSRHNVPGDRHSVEARVRPGGCPVSAYAFSIVTRVCLNEGTPVVGSTWTDIKSFTGGSLKCSGKKQVCGATDWSGCTINCSEPRSDVRRTIAPSPTASRSI